MMKGKLHPESSVISSDPKPSHIFLHDLKAVSFSAVFGNSMNKRKEMNDHETINISCFLIRYKRGLL